MISGGTSGTAEEAAVGSNRSSTLGTSSRMSVVSLRSDRAMAHCSVPRISRAGDADPPGRHVLDHALPVELRYGTFDDQPSEVQDGDPVGHGEDVVQVVGDDEHRQSPVAQ